MTAIAVANPLPAMRTSFAHRAEYAALRGAVATWTARGTVTVRVQPLSEPVPLNWNCTVEVKFSTSFENALTKSRKF